MKFKPCVRCGSTDVKISDCGYSSFNVGYATCPDCNYKVTLSPCGCFPEKEIVKAWNDEKKRLRAERDELLDKAAEIEELLGGYR